MDATLDTLATALYVKIDDLLKGAPQLAPWRPAVGIVPKLTDAELVTPAVQQALLGCCSEPAGWAAYGYCASHSRYFWGLRLHLVCTLHGLPVGFALAGANADERQVLLGILAADPTLVATRPGQT